MSGSLVHDEVPCLYNPFLHQNIEPEVHVFSESSILMRRMCLFITITSTWNRDDMASPIHACVPENTLRGFLEVPFSSGRFLRNDRLVKSRCERTRCFARLFIPVPGD